MKVITNAPSTRLLMVHVKEPRASNISKWDTLAISHFDVACEPRQGAPKWALWRIRSSGTFYVPQMKRLWGQKKNLGSPGQTVECTFIHGGNSLICYIMNLQDRYSVRSIYFLNAFGHGNLLFHKGAHKICFWKKPSQTREVQISRPEFSSGN